MPAIGLSLQERKTWEARIAGQNFIPRSYPIALYSGLDTNDQTRLARAEAPVHSLIDDTAGGKWLAMGLGKAMLDREFGPSWCEARREVWVMASLAFTGHARGEVIIYAGSKRIRPFKLAKNQNKPAPSIKDLIDPVFYDEVMNLDLLSPLQSNPAVTKVTIKEIFGGRVVGLVPLRASVRIH